MKNAIENEEDSSPPLLYNVTHEVLMKQREQ